MAGEYMTAGSDYKQTVTFGGEYNYDITVYYRDEYIKILLLRTKI